MTLRVNSKQPHATNHSAPRVVRSSRSTNRGLQIIKLSPLRLLNMLTLSHINITIFSSKSLIFYSCVTNDTIRRGCLLLRFTVLLLSNVHFFMVARKIDVFILCIFIAALAETIEVLFTWQTVPTVFLPL